MGILNNFEKAIEKSVNRAFAKTFKSEIQVIDIISSIKKEMDTNCLIIDRERTIAPGYFKIEISPLDANKINQYAQKINDEIIESIKKYAKSQNYIISGDIKIDFFIKNALSKGIINIETQSKISNSIVWVPKIIINSRKYTLSKEKTIVGRGTESDIVVDDNNVSRKHLAIYIKNKDFIIEDLKSTNGTKINGKSISKVSIVSDAEINIGETRIIFKLEPINKTNSHAIDNLNN